MVWRREGAGNRRGWPACFYTCRKASQVALTGTAGTDRRGRDIRTQETGPDCSLKGWIRGVTVVRGQLRFQAGLDWTSPPQGGQETSDMPKFTGSAAC